MLIIMPLLSGLDFIRWAEYRPKRRHQQPEYPHHSPKGVEILLPILMPTLWSRLIIHTTLTAGVNRRKAPIANVDAYEASCE